MAGAGEFGRAAREEDHTVLVVHERSGECLCMRSLHCRYDGLRMRPLSHIGRTHRYDGLRTCDHCPHRATAHVYSTGDRLSPLGPPAPPCFSFFVFHPPPSPRATGAAHLPRDQKRSALRCLWHEVRVDERTVR